MKFSVEITRTSYATKTFEVEAKNKQEAIDAALEEACNTCFEEDDAGYDVGYVDEYDYNLDINEREIHVGDKVYWLDDAGYDNETQERIPFTVVEKDDEQDGYFNIAYEGESNPERWAWHYELKVIE